MINSQIEHPELHRKISGINWNQVYYFSLVATYGSIKGTAELLSLSPSTLSEHISQLEKSLNVQLFSRQGRKLSLTEQGQRLFHHAKGMFENGHRLLDVVSPLQLGCYPISIGFVPSPHLHAAYEVVSHFAERFGPLNMKLHHFTQDGLESDLTQSKIDFGFSDRRPSRKNLHFKCVRSDLIRFFVSTKWKDLSMRELLVKIPLLVCRSQASTDAFIEKALQEAELTPSSIITSDYPGALLELCSRGLGVGAFCEDSLDFLPAKASDMRLLRKPKDAPDIKSNLYVIWSAEAESTEAISHLQKLIQT